MDRILSILKGQGSRRVTVVGAGYVGLEVAEQLKVAGHHVDLVERNPHVVPLLDAEMAAPINKTLQDHGIHLHLKKNVRTLQREGNRVTAVVLESGEVLPTDLVITAVGVKPRTELAVAAGLPVGKTGGIVVNEYMQTSDPDIFAVGDAVEYMHGVLHQPQRIPLAGPANRAGRVAGTVAAGGKSTPMGTVLGTAIVRVFDRTAGATGLSAKQMTRMQMPFRSVIIEAAHHASYFPGAKSMTLKVLYAPDSGKILGAQAVGMEGIDKRIDVIATVMHFGGTVEDLANVDLAYAPPFGSAKDPVHMAAFVALNDLGGMPTVLQHDAELDGFQLVDVRESAEIQRQPLPGAIHIPIDQIRQRWQELDLSKPTITVCQSGKRSHIAACFLRGKGLAAVKNLSGGMNIQGRLLKP